MQSGFLLSSPARKTCMRIRLEVHNHADDRVSLRAAVLSRCVIPGARDEDEPHACRRGGAPRRCPAERRRRWHRHRPYPCPRRFEIALHTAPPTTSRLGSIRPATGLGGRRAFFHRLPPPPQLTPPPGTDRSSNSSPGESSQPPSTGASRCGSSGSSKGRPRSVRLTAKNDH